MEAISGLSVGARLSDREKHTARAEGVDLRQTQQAHEESGETRTKERHGGVRLIKVKRWKRKDHDKCVSAPSILAPEDPDDVRGSKQGAVVYLIT